MFRINFLQIFCLNISFWLKRFDRLKTDKIETGISFIEYFKWRIFPFEALFPFRRFKSLLDFIELANQRDILAFLDIPLRIQTGSLNMRFKRSRNLHNVIRNLKNEKNFPNFSFSITLCFHKVIENVIVWGHWATKSSQEKNCIEKFLHHVVSKNMEKALNWFSLPNLFSTFQSFLTFVSVKQF